MKRVSLTVKMGENLLVSIVFNSRLSQRTILTNVSDSK